MRTNLSLVLLLACADCLASPPVCTAIEPKLTQPLQLTWDTETRKAEVFLLMDMKERKGMAISGQLALVRDHDTNGKKYNFLFQPANKALGDELEIMLFPQYPHTRDHVYRAKAVSYRLVDGTRYLNAGVGDLDLLCKGL